MEASKSLYSDSIMFLEHKIATYQAQLACNTLEKCNFIVEVGHLTVGTDDNGGIITSNQLCPIQFTENAVNQILRMKFTNSNGIVKPTVYLVKDWYLSKLQDCEETLTLLKKQPF